MLTSEKMTTSETQISTETFEENVTIDQEIVVEDNQDKPDLKTTEHPVKMNSNIMKSINDLLNAEILKFAKRVNGEYPDVPVDAILGIWCKQQNMSMSTFGLNGDYTTDTELDEDERKPVKRTPKRGKKKIEKPTSDDEDDKVDSDDADDEVKHGKPKAKKEKAVKEKKQTKECAHMYTKGKNAGTKCTTTVKGEGDYCSKHKK